MSRPSQAPPPPEKISRGGGELAEDPVVEGLGPAPGTWAPIRDVAATRFESSEASAQLGGIRGQYWLGIDTVDPLQNVTTERVYR